MKRHNLFLASLIMCVLASGCASTDSTLQSLYFDNASITATPISQSFDQIGPEPRCTELSLSLEYYNLSGDSLSKDFLAKRNAFFSDLQVFQNKKQKTYENFLKSDLYYDLTSACAENNEIHHTKEYIERIDSLVFSSLVVSAGSFGGDGYNSYTTFNYNLQNSSEILLSDVVSDYDTFAEIVINAINADPPSINYTDDFWYYEYLLINTFNNNLDSSDSKKVSWSLNKNGLTLYFSKYQIGSAYILTIPYESSCINSEYWPIEGEEFDSEYDNLGAHILDN